MVFVRIGVFCCALLLLPAAARAQDDPAAFERYTRWIQSVEREHSAAAVELASLPRRLRSARTETEFERLLERGKTACRLLERNYLRALPPIPPDCRSFHLGYTRVIRSEADLCLDILDGFAWRKVEIRPSLRSRAQATVLARLQSARELSRVYRERREPETVRVGPAPLPKRLADAVRSS